MRLCWLGLMAFRPRIKFSKSISTLVMSKMVAEISYNGLFIFLLAVIDGLESNN